MNVEFEEQKKRNIAGLGADRELERMALDFMRESARFNYAYNFTWMGVPIIQLPQDLIAVQELIWNVKPDVIVETGIAHGGGLVFYASLLELLGGDRRVVGVDIDIRPHNRAAIDAHPMRRRIEMIEGSSIDPAVVEQVAAFARGKRTLVGLDSDHSKLHVLEELRLYSPFVSAGSYIVVFDTTLEDHPNDFCKNRPWDKLNNPKTAVWDFLKETDRFVIDKEFESKLLLTVARDGFLRCVRD